MIFRIKIILIYINKDTLIYAIIFTVITGNSLYTIILLCSFQFESKNLLVANKFCKRIAISEYNLQKRYYTKRSLEKLKLFCADEFQKNPNYFASNILSKVKETNRY